MSSPSEEYRIDTETLEELEAMVSTCRVDSAHDIFKALADERRRHTTVVALTLTPPL